jgi:hypothetical protein
MDPLARPQQALRHHDDREPIAPDESQWYGVQMTMDPMLRPSYDETDSCRAASRFREMLGHGNQLVCNVAISTLEMPCNAMRRDDRLRTLSQDSLLLIEVCLHLGHGLG